MTSTSATTPIDSSASESVSRPSRDGSRGGLTGGGGGGGGTPSPGYGYGLLAYGPYGANGARYPVLPLVGSAAGGGAAVKDMVGGTSLGGTGGGGVGYGGGVGGVGYGGGTGGRDREPFRFARMIAASARPPMTSPAGAAGSRPAAGTRRHRTRRHRTAGRPPAAEAGLPAVARRPVAGPPAARSRRCPTAVPAPSARCRAGAPWRRRASPRSWGTWLPGRPLRYLGSRP